MAKKPTYKELEQRVTRILIVDDELVSREKLRNIMDTFGQCIVVENGADALRVATSQNPPDLILLDIIMPGIDGYEVCKKLKSNTKTSNIPVIFISAKSKEDDEAQGLGLGAVDYITKPFSPAIVKARVRTHLELKKHRNRLEELVNERTVELKKATKEMQTEIAERKRAEKALRESEEKFKVIFEQAAVGVAQIESETGRFFSVNQKYCDIIGYTREEMMGVTLEEITHPDDLQISLDNITRLIRREIRDTAFEKRYIHKDGSTVWINLTISPMWGVDEKSNYHIAVVEDITDRKQVAGALRKSEEKFSKLFLSSPILVTLSKLEDGTHLEVNDAFEKSTGFDRKEVIGRTSIECGLWADPKEREGFKKLAQDEGGFRAQEVNFLTKKGDPLTILWSADVIELDGETCLLATAMDISELKQAEQEKIKLQDQLHQAQKMEAIGTLSGGVAHDLNNILGGLVGYPELLLLQLPEDSPLRKSILTIQKSGEKAAAVVQDLLTLARRGVVVTEVVNVNDIISEYLKSPEHKKLLSYHPGVHIETHLEKDVLNILGSSTHLSKTVMNLISNAAEAMPEGGKLTISTENRYIDRPIVGYDDVKEGDYVVLTFSDTGVGISPDDIGKIFEPFYTKKKMGRSGTGLGMAVVWGTVKDHNGYIDLQSAEGKGTTFTLYFPVTREKLSEDKSCLTSEAFSSNGESVLIVDDVEEQRRIASGMLKELGYSVVSVSSGEEAVEYLNTNKVDLLVLDMIMDPGMDGLDTYKKILELHPGQKAIIASGFSETDRVKEAQRLGAGTYIRKPFLLEKIGHAVKEELGK